MVLPIGVARRAVEAKIEELIALLDLLDGDVDLEPGNDNEPTLGWPEGWPGQGATRLRNVEEDDRELEDENDEDSDPAEFNGDEQDYNGDEFDTDWSCLGQDGESRQ
ncbi:MAG TPA: hypothetical protein VGN93_13195 [Shinella sp.]|jgi:hypothetical protein|uniref:hypothetical protein n=1 Tax=Shinella sp. TaxID=1870904 RepID=UPI002E11E6F9|nr:hypothetical protein [Shinella sp.]